MNTTFRVFFIVHCDDMRIIGKQVGVLRGPAAVYDEFDYVLGCFD